MKVWAAVVALLVVACSAPIETPSPTPTLGPTASATASPLTPTLPPTFTSAPTASSSASFTAPPPASVEPAPTDAALTPVLQHVLDAWRSGSGAPGAALGFRLADGRTAIVASGLANEGANIAAGATDRFRIGSITKTFVATVILQLAAEGHLRLDDRVSVYLPDAPHGGEITVRQLLNHTSGLHEFGDVATYRIAVLAAPARAWTAAQTISLIADLALDFAPGSEWQYSNTNYVALGQIAEQSGGKPLAQLLRERIYTPLGLGDTYLEEEEPGPPMVETGHYDLDGDGKPDNVASMQYTALVTSGAAAGGISSTALDVIDFAAGLFGGRLLDATWLDEMLTIRRPSTTYGLGISRLVSGERKAWGHAGGIPGFTALLARADDGSIAVAFANETGVDVGQLVTEAAAALARLP